MITTRIEKLEQLLTENCRKALAEIDNEIQSVDLFDLEFDNDDIIDISLSTPLNLRVVELVREVLELAGWKNIHFRDNRVRFYF